MITETITIKKRINRKLYICRTCGTPIKRKGGLCVKCYKEQRRNGTYQGYPEGFSYKRHPATKYPCVKNCGRLVYKKEMICRVCRDKHLLEKGEKQQAEKDRQYQAKLERLLNKPIEREICSASPTQAHYWEINGANIGKCKWCKKIKNYTKLQTEFWRMVMKLERA